MKESNSSINKPYIIIGTSLGAKTLGDLYGSIKIARAIKQYFPDLELRFVIDRTKSDYSVDEIQAKLATTESDSIFSEINLVNMEDGVEQSVKDSLEKACIVIDSLHMYKEFNKVINKAAKDSKKVQAIRCSDWGRINHMFDRPPWMYGYLQNDLGVFTETQPSCNKFELLEILNSGKLSKEEEDSLKTLFFEETEAPLFMAYTNDPKFQGVNHKSFDYPINYLDLVSEYVKRSDFSGHANIVANRMEPATVIEMLKLNGYTEISELGSHKQSKGKLLTATDPKTGKSITVWKLLPVPQKIFHALLDKSVESLKRNGLVPIALCTGTQSLEDILKREIIPMYQVCNWHAKLPGELLNLMLIKITMEEVERIIDEYTIGHESSSSYASLSLEQAAIIKDEILNMESIAEMLGSYIMRYNKAPQSLEILKNYPFLSGRLNQALTKPSSMAGNLFESFACQRKKIYDSGYDTDDEMSVNIEIEELSHRNYDNEEQENCVMQQTLFSESREKILVPLLDHQTQLQEEIYSIHESVMANSFERNLANALLERVPELAPLHIDHQPDVDELNTPAIEFTKKT